MGKKTEREELWITTGWSCPWCGAREDYDLNVEKDPKAGADDFEGSYRYYGPHAGLLPYVVIRYRKANGETRIRYSRWYPIEALGRLSPEKRELVEAHEEVCRCACRAGLKQPHRMQSWDELFGRPPELLLEDRLIRLSRERTLWLALRRPGGSGRRNFACMALMIPNSGQEASRIIRTMTRQIARSMTLPWEETPARDRFTEAERAREYDRQEKGGHDDNAESHMARAGPAGISRAPRHEGAVGVGARVDRDQTG